MIKKFEDKMQKSIESLEREYNSIRAGRANPHVLDKIKVDYYGTPTPLQQVGNISVPEPRIITIQPWETSLLKAIDGVYDSDPKVNPDAVKYDEISLDEVLSKKLGVIDLTATIMCLENKMPLVIFGLEEENSIVNTMSGNFNGTYVTV